MGLQTEGGWRKMLEIKGFPAERINAYLRLLISGL
jgi:hypothetical protein